MLELHQFACLSDNYGYLLHDPASGETACIDTPDAEAYLREAAAKGWSITQIWNTHWHPDHAGGNQAIKDATDCTIYAPAEVEGKFPVDHIVGHDDYDIRSFRGDGAVGDRLRLGASTTVQQEAGEGKGGESNGHKSFRLVLNGTGSFQPALRRHLLWPAPSMYLSDGG